MPLGCSNFVDVGDHGEHDFEAAVGRRAQERLQLGLEELRGVKRHPYPFFFSSRRLHTRWPRDWSSDVCSSDLVAGCTVPRKSFGKSTGVKTFVATGVAAGSEERRVGKECRSRWSAYD